MWALVPSPCGRLADLLPPLQLCPSQAKKQDYTYKLAAKVSAYNLGLVSPTGYYKLNVQGGQYTTFTWWWQVRTPQDWAHAPGNARAAALVVLEHCA